MGDPFEEIMIQSSAEHVWAVLADFGGISGWASNVDHSCLTTGQHEGIGAERRIQVGRNTVLERVTAWEPASHLAYSIIGFPPVVREVTNAWTLEPVGDATRVRLTTHIQPGPRPPHRAAARVIGRALAKASVQMLDGLDAYVRKTAA